MSEADLIKLYERFRSDVIGAIEAARKATRTTTIEHYTALLMLESKLQHALLMLEKRSEIVEAAE
jgi:hypothetical protein